MENKGKKIWLKTRSDEPMCASEESNQAPQKQDRNVALRITDKQTKVFSLDDVGEISVEMPAGLHIPKR